MVSRTQERKSTSTAMKQGAQPAGPDESEQDQQAIARHAAARSAQDVQTISLFTAAFIILGLNSFIWGVVAGSRALTELGVAGGVGPSELRSRVWSQAIIAVGMLSLGAIAMVCNITSLFLWQQSAILSESDRRYLRAFLIIVTAAAVLGVIAFVGSDSLNFLQVVYDGHVPLWFSSATLLVTIGGLGVALYVGARRYFGKTSSATTHTGRPKIKDRMKIPTGLIIMYALIGSVAVTAAAHYPGWPKPLLFDLPLAGVARRSAHRPHTPQACPRARFRLMGADWYFLSVLVGWAGRFPFRCLECVQ